MVTYVRRGMLRCHLSGWELQQAPGRVRAYVYCVHAAVALWLAAAAARVHWDARDFAVFAALTACAAITIEATRNVSVAHGTVFRDMQAVWYIAAVALVPVFYTLLLPLVLAPYRLARMSPGVTYRRVVSGSVCALAYGVAGVVFAVVARALDGAAPDTARHVVIWFAMLFCCGALGLVVNNILVITAIKLSDPAARIGRLALNRDALVSDLCQISLAVLVTLPAAFNPLLLGVALPIVAMMRRFLMHAQLLTASRVDGKTGLLNAVTWQQEADIEVSRAIRTGSPLAIAVADIDHFKAVNDRYGHVAGDAVLALLAATMSAVLRDYDLVGRFGGEEFVICLPQTGPDEAFRVAERLRDTVSRIAADAPGGELVQITVSVGVTSLEHSRRSLDELILAADTALYQAKKAGRNCARIIRDEPAFRKAG